MPAFILAFLHCPFFFLFPVANGKVQKGKQLCERQEYVYGHAHLRKNHCPLLLAMFPIFRLPFAFRETSPSGSHPQDSSGWKGCQRDKWSPPIHSSSDYIFILSFWVCCLLVSWPMGCVVEQMVFLGLYCLTDALLLISESVLIVSLLNFVCCHLCSLIEGGKGCYFLQFSWLIL